MLSKLLRLFSRGLPETVTSMVGHLWIRGDANVADLLLAPHAVFWSWLQPLLLPADGVLYMRCVATQCMLHACRLNSTFSFILTACGSRL